jgi:hypothetical protein
MRYQTAPPSDQRLLRAKPSTEGRQCSSSRIGALSGAVLTLPLRMGSGTFRGSALVRKPDGLESLTPVAVVLEMYAEPL